MEPRRRGSKGAHIPKLCPACTCRHPRDFHRVRPIVSVTLDNPHVSPNRRRGGRKSGRLGRRAGRLGTIAISVSRTRILTRATTDDNRICLR